MENYSTSEGTNEIDGNDEKKKILYNLQIAHEIAMSSNPGEVRLEDLVPKNELWTKVSEQIHSAFWDIFRQEITSEPPKLNMALMLIKDIKESLYSVMTPNLSKLKEEVEEVLDEDLMKQQAEHGTVDVQSYALFVISVMKKICAPIRDKSVTDLTNLTDIVAIFRGILETLNMMKLDLMNYSIKAVTPEILANQQEYERKKFNEYVELLGGILPITEGWLKRNKENSQSLSNNEILYGAFMELLTWGANEPLPETLFMDAPRLSIIKREYYNLIIASSITIISLSCSPSDLSTDTTYKEALKKNVSVLMNGISTDEALKMIMPNLSEQIKKEANDKLTAKGKEVMSDFMVKGMEQQLMEVISPENKIRSLVGRRINDYFKASLLSSSGNGPFPLALILFQNELETLNAKFKHLVMYNIKICGTQYTKILQS